MPKGYKAVSVPEDLCNEVADILEDNNLGYRSVSEFIIDATRRRVETFQIAESENVELEVTA